MNRSSIHPPLVLEKKYHNRSLFARLSCALAAAALLLTACPQPGGGGTTPTYTTTVSGKVITPARAADPAKGNNITTARVWSSIDPAKKIDVGADGSYSLQVAGHKGSFAITAEYTATDGNYKASTARTISTTGAEVNNQDIPLNYGYTTEFTVRVNLSATPASRTSSWGSGVRVVITAENGHKVGEGLTSGVVSPNGAVITVDHPGRIRATASFSGYAGSGGSETTSITTTARTQSAQTLYLYSSP